MYQDGKLIIAKGQAEVCLLPSMANRHGLIAGATGTGKTVTLKTIAQSFSDVGVPTFLADVKGDVSGVAIAGEASPKLVERLSKLGITDYPFHGCPTQFWDVYGEKGLPVRTTISAMGPVLIGRLLELNEVQQGVLTIVFRVADEKKLLLLDLKDLRTMVSWVGDHAKELSRDYGNIAAASVGAIQRSLLTLEDAGGDIFFGEPALDISDWMTCDADGMGTINVLNCVKLVQSPLLYSTFLLWMLTSVYEELPEAGDLDKPKMVFFFDEAHLLFDDAPKALLDKVVQVVKLIRSKGVGVYFITQNPSDIPDEVLGQLGNRVQHALRAYTPAEQKAIKAAAQAFRENPAFKTEEAITELGTGEALISFLDEKGAPSVVERAMVIAPTCSMGAAPDEVVADI
ncbi:MAG: helicase HerA-like domain-containing protein, partial [Coriobacteriales bacterium]|nr:helicase HerA-like domain-containing protein [Coriobacteriales bacterium]